MNKPNQDIATERTKPLPPNYLLPEIVEKRRVDMRAGTLLSSGGSTRGSGATSAVLLLASHAVTPKQLSELRF